MYLFAAAQLKSVELSPFELIERLMFIGLVVYVAFILGIFFLKRGLAWLDDRFLIAYTGHVPTYGRLQTLEHSDVFRLVGSGRHRL